MSSESNPIQDTIPCLSLWQPWATLMAIGAKVIDPRSVAMISDPHIRADVEKILKQ